MTLTARWIWSSAEQRPLNQFVYFRRAFLMPETGIRQALARVSADARYKLFVNGLMAGHGPARFDPRHPAHDTLDITASIQPGVNVLAAIASFDGIGTAASMIGFPGFLLQVDFDTDDGPLCLITDHEWAVAPAPYRSNCGRMSIQLPYPEDFDAVAEPIGWREIGFDDAGWAPAIEIANQREALPRDIPGPGPYSVALPRTVVSILEARALPADAGETIPTPAETMEHATLLTPAPERVTLAPTGDCLVAPAPLGRATSIVLDFGCEVSGFPIIEAAAGSEGRIDIGYSERIEPDGTVNPNRFGGCDVHYADRLRLREGAQSWSPISPRAFRYLRLDVVGTTEPVRLRALLHAFAYPVTHRGEFRCSDNLLNQIWATGRYTAEMCMDDAYMDCPWRERGQWLADARIEALVALYAFGDTALARRALRQFAQSQGVLDAFNGGAEPPPHHAEAWVKCLYPASPPFDTVLPTFNCIWIQALWEHFLVSGDQRLLAELWPNVDALTRLLRRHETPNGLIANLPGWVFVDWAPVDVSGEATHVNALYCAALSAAARIARTVGRPADAEQLEARAAAVREAINDLTWDPAAGLFAEGWSGGARSAAFSEQANVLCILCGIAEHDQRDSILAAFYTPEGQARLPEGAVRIATPYFAFYLLRALYALDRHDLALEYIRQRWGDMLNRGATTFWEQFEPEWSLCHAWSAAPTHDLPAEVAGIRPVQPGFEEFTIAPRPVDLTWIRATVPSPRGDIRLAWHYRTDQPFRDAMGGVMPVVHPEPAVTAAFNVPAGCKGHVSIPLAGISRPTVLVNAERIYVDGDPCSPTADRVSITDGNLTFLAPPGDYLVEVRRTP